MLKQRVIKIGGHSGGILLPKALRQILGINIGDYVELGVMGEKIILKKAE